MGITRCPTATSAINMACGRASPIPRGQCHVAGKCLRDLPPLPQHPCDIMGSCCNVSIMLPHQQHDATSVMGPPPYAPRYERWVRIYTAIYATSVSSPPMGMVGVVSLAKGRLWGHGYFVVLHFYIHLHRYKQTCYILIINTHFVVILNILN